MKHRLLLALAASLLVCSAVVAGATAGPRAGGQLFSFSGELLATPGANATSLSVQVETGNKPALRALIGASQDEVFALDSNTESSSTSTASRTSARPPTSTPATT